MWHDGGCPCWTFETDIPHETFTIVEDGEIWCVGIVFSMKFLAPLENLEYLRLYERGLRSGGVYIVAKVGLVVQAVILPVDVVNEDFIRDLAELTELCRRAMLLKTGE